MGKLVVQKNHCFGHVNMKAYTESFWSLNKLKTSTIKMV